MTPAIWLWRGAASSCGVIEALPDPQARRAPPKLWTSTSFAIGFDHRDRERLYELWERVPRHEHVVGRADRARLRGDLGAWNGLPAVASHSWTGAALAALEFFELRGKTVLCPSNTFMASPLVIEAVGAHVEFVDCNRDDLCMSFDDLERKVALHKPAAVMLVHIGGHLAFESERIAALCAAEGIVLIEDCAHAHGAAWNGRKAGSYGDVGLWSFAPTKTDLDRRGRPARLAPPGARRVRARLPQLRQARLYPARAQLPDERVHRRPRVLAAERLEEIVGWKNTVARERARPALPRPRRAPDGDGLRRTTSTSSSSRSSARPARSTTSRATA